MSRFDVVIVGAGANGLTTAALLARRGRRVIVLERLEQAGGRGAAEEFHPGYRSGGLLQDASTLRASVVRDLELGRHGLSVTPGRSRVLAWAETGGPLLLGRTTEETVANLGSLSGNEARNYAAYRRGIERLAPVLRAFLERPPLDLVRPESNSLAVLARRALQIRRLGASDTMELLRIPPMCVADWLGEWFGSEPLKAALAVPAISGSYAGPWSPATAFNLLLWEVAAGSAVEGGPSAVVEALERAARASGAEIRTGASVAGITLNGDAASGVRLNDGETIEARRVALAGDVKRGLLDLLPPGAIPHRLRRRIENYRSRGTTAALDLAVAAGVQFEGGEGAALARTGGSLDDLERAFDPVKYRALPETPLLEIHLPTLQRPELAPEGCSVVSVLVHFVPYELDGGWSDERRQILEERALARLERALPGLTKTVVGRRLRVPADLERQYALSGGQIHGGEQSLDQLLVRPAPECFRYSTPVPDLFLCGSGSHPGGGLSCGPGALAADAILDSR